MTEIPPLPPEMLAGGVDEFIKGLPVESIQVEDRDGVNEYGPPEPQDAPSEGSGTVVPSWATQDAPEAPQEPASAPGTGATQPQPGQVPVQPAAIVFNQPAAPTFGWTHVGSQPGQDLTLEERVEWLENELDRIGRRLESLITTNNLWDGS